MRGDGADDDGVHAAPSSSATPAGMTGLHVGMALVVHVVQEPDGAPQLRVLAETLGIGAHRGLHGQAMAAQRLRLDPFTEKVPRLVARKLHRHGC